MKKIIIINNNLHIGGVQKSLINLLEQIKEKYDITLLLFNASGEYKKDIPNGVKILEIKSGFRYLGMTKYDTKTNVFNQIKRTFYAGITRCFGRKMAVMLMGLTQKSINGYDIAISFLHNSSDNVFYGGCNEFVLKHIEAEKKVAFLHCDYMKCGANTLQNAQNYEKFDIIAACSKGCADSFISANPNLKKKVKVVYNSHNYNDIISLADKKNYEYNNKKINIVTVARLGKEKGVKRAVEVISELGKWKNAINYYIIGDGIERKEIEHVIQSNGLENTVTLCGELSNPYGYMKNADVLLIPSYSEAAPLVINEAACLGTPIISTQTSSSIEMIQEKNFGWICDNSNEGILKILLYIINNPKEIAKKKELLKDYTFDNSIAIQQFDDIINI